MVNASYEDVYNRIYNRATECLQRHLPGASVIVQNQIDPRAHQANVTTATVTATAFFANFTIDIRGLESDKTEVKTYSRHNYQSSQDFRTKTVKGWAEDSSRECP